MELALVTSVVIYLPLGSRVLSGFALVPEKTVGMLICVMK